MKHASINQSINFIHCLQKYIYTIKHKVALGVFHTNWDMPNTWKSILGIGNTELLLLRQGLFGEGRDFYHVTTLKRILKTVTSVRSKMIKLCYRICKSIKPCRFLQNKNKILVVFELICPQIQIANKKLGIN